MASFTTHTVNNSAPVLIFSGVGNLLIKVATEHVYIGGSGVTGATDGMFISINYEPVFLNVTSPDDIYAIGASATTSTIQVYHNL